MASELTRAQLCATARSQVGFAERKPFRDKLEENAVRFTRPRVNVLSIAVIIVGLL